jgi:RNA recognition motif-containing protein
MRTTVMLRNLPNKYKQSMILDLLDTEGFAGLYDFFYLPMDFRNEVSMGYAFINLISHSEALRLMKRFQGFQTWLFNSQKVCEVSWSHPHQGLAAHIERYRNSPVMHESMLAEYKPVLFRNGKRIDFPPPTRRLRAPRLRPQVNGEDYGENDWA